MGSKFVKGSTVSKIPGVVSNLMQGVRELPKVWFYLAGLFTWIFWISGILGNSGLFQAYRLSIARKNLVVRTTSLNYEKLRLHKHLRLLDKDVVTQEIAVRETLGFVRPDEIIFDFKD